MPETPSSDNKVRGVAEETYLSSAPIARYYYATVEFPYADVDVAVEHPLLPKRPDVVNYQVVQATEPVQVYHQMNGRPWTQTRIFLRANVEGATVRVLLSVPTNEDILTPLL